MSYCLTNKTAGWNSKREGGLLVTGIRANAVERWRRHRRSHAGGGLCLFRCQLLALADIGLSAAHVRLCPLMTKAKCSTSDIEGAAERAQTLVNKKSRAARSREQRGPTVADRGDLRGSVGHPRS